MKKISFIFVLLLIFLCGCETLREIDPETWRTAAVGIMGVFKQIVP